MTATWLRRTARLAATATVVVLAACGSGTIDSALSPSRFVGFGDAFSDVGFNGGARYTVNDGSTNIWTQQIASRYGQTLAPQSLGGTSYARGNARVTAKPDAAGDNATLTLKEQIDAFATTGRFGGRDVVLVNAGISDIVAISQSATTDAARIDGARRAAQDFGVQVRRLVDLGAKYILVAGTYDIGRTPYGRASGRAAVLTEMGRQFNDQFKIAAEPLGENLLYVDAENFINIVIGSPASYSISNATAIACTSVDPGAGIGIGAGQVNSARCNPGTTVAGVDYNAYLFADNLYLTPNGQRQFGNFAYDRLRARW